MRKLLFVALLLASSPSRADPIDDLAKTIMEAQAKGAAFASKILDTVCGPILPNMTEAERVEIRKCRIEALKELNK